MTAPPDDRPPPPPVDKRLHAAIDDLSVAVAHLQLAAKELSETEGDTAAGNFRLLIYSERAKDLATSVSRLASDIRSKG